MGLLLKIEAEASRVRAQLLYNREKRSLHIIGRLLFCYRDNSRPFCVRIVKISPEQRLLSGT